MTARSEHGYEIRRVDGHWERRGRSKNQVWKRLVLVPKKRDGFSWKWRPVEEICDSDLQST